jgi:predicted AAA+ superfamily ATPase
MIDRTIETTLKELPRKYPVVTITGPRQTGKPMISKILGYNFD